MEEWDAELATKANISLEQLRGFEAIFRKLDPDNENEINVTKFVRAGLGRATIPLQLTSRDLRRLFAALRQTPTVVGDPAHISLPVTPNEYIMAMASPPMLRRCPRRCFVAHPELTAVLDQWPAAGGPEFRAPVCRCSAQCRRIYGAHWV